MRHYENCDGGYVQMGDRGREIELPLLQGTEYLLKEWKRAIKREKFICRKSMEEKIPAVKH